jgi:ATP synthase F0 subunit b
MATLLNYLGVLIGFVVIVWVLVRKVYPGVNRMATERQQLVEKQVRDAEEASARLAEAERKYSEALTEARTEAAKIRDGARADAERILAEMREQAQAEVTRIRKRGEEDLATQRQQVIRELRGRIGELSVNLAGELVAEHLSATDRREASVDKLLDELEAMAASEGNA